MRKLRKVVPFGLAVMMSLQGIYPAVPVMADTVKVAAAKKTTSSATVLSKKERAKIMQQINAMSPEEGLKLAKKKGLIKEDTDTKESNLKKTTVNKDAKEGEVGYQFTQDQYVDETHRIRYEYIITAEGEVSADYIMGIYYKDGKPETDRVGADKSYIVEDELTYPTSVTLNGTTYKVKIALNSYVKAKHLIIPEGIEEVSVSSSDDHIEKMTIPSTTKKIRGTGFYGVYTNTDKTELDWKKKQVFKGYELTNPEKAKYITVKDGIIYNKDETELLARIPACLEKDTVILPDTLQKIPSGAFQSCVTVKKVVFGKNITSIGNGAFAYSNIENVQMNDNVTVLDEYAFYYCTKLANVDLSKSLTKIDGYKTFKYTDALKHIDLKNVTELTGWYTFRQSGLEDIDLSNISNMDGVQMFSNCPRLKTVYIGKNTNFESRFGIGSNYFAACGRLENYVEKEKNNNHLYVEDGKLYSSRINALVQLADNKTEERVLTGKILLGYPIQQQKKYSEEHNGTLKFDEDITAIGLAGISTYAEYLDENNNIEIADYCNKIIIPSSVEAFEHVVTRPTTKLDIEVYGNKMPAFGLSCVYSRTEDGANVGTANFAAKTVKFKTAALKDEFDQHWKKYVMYLYDAEPNETAVLPEKKTTSLTLNKTSDKILCDGTSHEIHLIAKLSEDDCTDVVTFKSSNEDLATVDGNGVVTTKANAHGSATITATAGDHTATYKLTQAGSGINVTADQKTIVYKEWWETENLLDNIKKSIDVTCADCHNNLERDKDYEVIVSDYKKTGKVDVTIKGIGAFEGMTAKTSVNVEYHKHGEQGYRIDDLYSGYNWTGKEVRPDLKVYCNDCNKELKEGTDYKLEYKNNVNVGTATVKIVGMGAYEGVDRTANFEIEEDCGWNGIAVNDNAYQDGDHIGTYKWSRWKENGNLPTVVIVCKHCGKWLTKDTDYKLEYSNKDHPGDGTLKVTGLNKYAGYELNFKYTLSPKTFYSNEHSDGDDLGTFRYTGKAIKADIGTLYIENTDTEAVEGKDYQLEYSNNINEGTATVKVVGIGDAKGTVLTYTYHIEKQHGWNGFYSKGHKDGESLGTFKWTGNTVLIDPDMRCSHCDKELQENVDYKIEYSNNIDPGVASMKIIGMGDYKGYELNFTFVIEKKAPTTTEDQKPTTTTTETKPTTSSTTTETKPATTETRPSTEDSSTSGTTAAKKETATTAAPVIRISVKKAAIQKIKALKKAFTINILKNKDQVTGYQISYSYKKNFKGQKVKTLKKFKYKKIKVKRKKYTIVSYKVKGLKKKKTVYVRVRAYKQVGKTKVYGKWSSVKKVKIK